MRTLFTTSNLDRQRRAARSRWRVALHSAWLVPLLLFPLAYVTIRPVSPEKLKEFFGGGPTVPSNLKLDGIARIETQGGGTVGTGFLVAENLLLTAAHVTGADPAPVVIFSYGKPEEIRMNGKVVASGYESFIKTKENGDDWALVELATARPAGHVYLLDDSSLAKETQRVWAVGFPLGGDLNVSGGVVSGLRKDSIVTDAAIDHGYSGGPLFSADSNLVLGIIASVAVDPGDNSRSQSLHFAVPINDVAAKCEKAGRPIK